VTDPNWEYHLHRELFEPVATESRYGVREKVDYKLLTEAQAACMITKRCKGITRYGGGGKATFKLRGHGLSTNRQLILKENSRTRSWIKVIS